MTAPKRRRRPPHECVEQTGLRTWTKAKVDGSIWVHNQQVEMAKNPQRRFPQPLANMSAFQGFSHRHRTRHQPTINAISPSILSKLVVVFVVVIISMVLMQSLPLNFVPFTPANARSIDVGSTTQRPPLQTMQTEPTAQSDFDLATIANTPSSGGVEIEFKQLNESLKALEKLVVGEEGALPSNLTTGKKWIRGEFVAQQQTTDEQEVEVEEEDNDYGNSLDGAGGGGGPIQHRKSAAAAAIRTSLVRQLSDLLMNHAPKEISRTIGGATASLPSVELRQLRKGRQLLQENTNEPSSQPASDLDGDLFSSAEGQDDLSGLQTLQQQQQQQPQMQEGEQAITCSPDYEDQTIMVDPASGMNELFNGPGGTINGTAAAGLSAEQRAQLLSGADSAGLLNGELLNDSSLLHATNQQHRSQMQQQQQHVNSLIGQCVPAGSRMIEVITKIITPILFSIIIVVGLVGNIIVMLVILEDRKLERELTPTNLLILDLSLADLSFIIFCIPFTGWDYAVGHWVFGSLWCKLNQYLIVVCALSSIYTLVLMSCDRFMAIVYPIECINYRTSRNMLHAIVIKWIVILLVASPTMLVHGLIDSPLGPDQYNCRFLSDQHNPLHFQIIFFFTSYLFPLILIFGLYLSLLNKLWFGQKPQGHKESHKMLESKKKVTWLVASIVIVFAACWFPIQIMLILMRLKSHKITATYVAVQVFAHTLGYMNSCVNPIVYAFASETFNQSFKKSWLARLFFCCYCTPSHQHEGNTNNSINNNNNNNSHYYNNPTNGLTNNTTTNVTNLTSGVNHRRDSALRNDFNQRSSLQGSPKTSNGGGDNQQRNQSLNYIFSGSSQATAPRKLPLEPRDRPQAISPPPPPALQLPVVAQATSSQNQQSPTNSTTSANNKSAQGNSQQSGAETSQAAKQQLVARVVGPTGGYSGNPVVAHQCEPHEAEY